MQDARDGSIWSKWRWLIAILVGLMLPAILAFSLAFILRDADFAVFGLVVLGWIFAQLIALLGWLTRQYSGRVPTFVLLMAPGLVCGFVPAIVVLAETKQMIARDLVARSAPVIAAVDAFHAARGRWPEDIKDLVPGFLPAPPKTGSALYPEYRLESGDRAAEFGNPWMLEIPMYESLKFDALYYCPVTDCEAEVREIGGGTVRIGKWIFLDE